MSNLPNSPPNPSPLNSTSEAPASHSTLPYPQSAQTLPQAAIQSSEAKPLSSSTSATKPPSNIPSPSTSPSQRRDSLPPALLSQHPGYAVTKPHQDWTLPVTGGKATKESSKKPDTLLASPLSDALPKAPFLPDRQSKSIKIEGPTDTAPETRQSAQSKSTTTPGPSDTDPSWSSDIDEPTLGGEIWCLNTVNRPTDVVDVSVSPPNQVALPEMAFVNNPEDEFCPFTWEMRADGKEWSEWSEDAVLSFMKNVLGYDEGALDEPALTDEEIRLFRVKIENHHVTPQQLLEKKKQGLSESLKKWQPPQTSNPSPASSAGSVLALTSAESDDSEGDEICIFSSVFDCEAASEDFLFLI